MSAKFEIRSVSITGYGIFRDKTCSFTDSSFVLVYGSNEVGKTTLFSFLRGMIAGFPSLKKKLENRYLPINGGEYGGEASVSCCGNDYTITKSGKDLSVLVVKGDGKDKLEKLLSGLDREHYKAIFAFDLIELTSLKLLDDASLNERLFSSFVEGSNDLVSSALKDLEKSKQEITRARSKGKIDYLYQDFKNGEERIFALEQELEERAIKASLLNGLESSILLKRQELELVSKGIENLKDIKEAGDIISSLEKEKKLKELLSAVPLISAEEESQYQELSSKRNILTQELKNLELEINKDKAEQAERESILKSLCLEDIEEYEWASKLRYYSGLLSMGLGVIFGILIFLFFSSRISFFEVSLGIVLFSLVCGLTHLYTKRRYSLSIYPLFDFVSFVGQELPYDVEQLKREYYVLQSLHGERSERDKESELRIINLRSQLESLSKHSLGHLFDSDFLELRENRIKLIECNARIESLEHALKSLNLPHVKDLEAPYQDLERLSLDRIRISKELDHLLEEKGSIKASLEKLASSSELQELRLDIYAIKSEIERLLFAWRVDTVAEFLLKNALKKVGEVAFKNVSTIASNYFKRITLGGYIEVILSDQGDTVLVRDINNRKLEPAQLSKGTVEQLYLSLRLALVKVSKDSIGQLPILLDDVLVNFDKQRALEVVKILKEISKENQIFYFTCHEWVRNLYSQEMGGEGLVLSAI